MITTTKAYQTEDGKSWATLEEAKIHAIETLFGFPETITPERVVKESDKVMAILKMGEVGRPRKSKEIKGFIQIAPLIFLALAVPACYLLYPAFDVYSDLKDGADTGIMQYEPSTY